jgi:hypothetical protein
VASGKGYSVRRMGVMPLVQTLFVGPDRKVYLPYARGQACKRESMLNESKFREIMNYF